MWKLLKVGLVIEFFALWHYLFTDTLPTSNTPASLVFVVTAAVSLAMTGLTAMCVTLLTD